VSGPERDKGADQPHDGLLIFFWQRGHHPKSLPQATRLWRIIRALDLRRF
jgi:hypothetical protein